MNTDPEQTTRSESNPPTLPTRRNRQLEPHKSASPHLIPLARSDPARQGPQQWRIPHASKKPTRIETAEGQPEIYATGGSFSRARAARTVVAAEEDG
jgi:hypothetical protein